MVDREFLIQWRESLLQMLDVIERKLNISPRTAELRKEAKREKLLTARADRDTLIANTSNP